MENSKERKELDPEELERAGGNNDSASRSIPCPNCCFPVPISNLTILYDRPISCPVCGLRIK